MSCEKKVALITGGTSGIGLAAAKKFLKENYAVLVCSIDGKEKVDTALKVLKELGEVDYCYLDVADEQSCKEAAAYAVERFGGMDCLLNVAGVVGTLRPITETDMADVRKTIQINLMGTIYMSYYVSQYMILRKSGVIVNISSISGSMVTNVGVGYHSSKSGVDMAAKVMAKDLAKHGIRCISIAPGSVNTEMQDPRYVEESARFMLKNRLIEPEEIANAAYLMCMDEASAINGTLVMADDGFTAWKSLWE